MCVCVRVRVYEYVSVCACVSVAVSMCMCMPAKDSDASDIKRNLYENNMEREGRSYDHGFVIWLAATGSLCCVCTASVTCVVYTA